MCVSMCIKQSKALKYDLTETQSNYNISGFLTEIHTFPFQSFESNHYNISYHHSELMCLIKLLEFKTCNWY